MECLNGILNMGPRHKNIWENNRKKSNELALITLCQSTPIVKILVFFPMAVEDRPGGPADIKRISAVSA